MNTLLKTQSLVSSDIYGIKTFEGGSAKIQRLPILQEVFYADSYEELLNNLCDPKNSEILREFAQNIRVADGNYSTQADTIDNLLNKAGELLDKLRNKGLSKDNINSINFTLRYIYSAMFKTAGNITMNWGGWTADPEINSAKLTRAANLGIADMQFAVQISPSEFEQLSRTNQLIYNILNSLLNQAASELGDASDVFKIRQKAIELSTNRNQIVLGIGQGKDSIKIDYKLGKSGKCAVVDINAGNMGIPDGTDFLGNKVREVLNMDRLAVTDAVIEAIMGTFNSQELRFPRKVSIVVLDESMLNMNLDDIRGYIDAIIRFSSSRSLGIEVDVITMKDIQEKNITSDLLFRYTGRAQLSPEKYGELKNNGIVILPEQYTNIMADKISAQFVSNLGSSELPEMVYVPTEIQSTNETGFYEKQIDLLLDEAFNLAKAENWKGIVIKTATKFRKPQDNGTDFPTAFIYPVTNVGYEVAKGELKSLIKNLAQNELAKNLRLSFNQLFEEGLEDESGNERQVEIRLITTLEA